jgi:hypothetical protein
MRKVASEEALGLAAAVLMINHRREAMCGGLFQKLDNVITRRRGYRHALPHGSPLLLPT